MKMKFLVYYSDHEVPSDIREWRNDACKTKLINAKTKQEAESKFKKKYPDMYIRFILD